MESYLRIGLLVLAAVILFLMLVESRSKRRTRMNTSNYPQETPDFFTGELPVENKIEIISHMSQESLPPELVVISVVAKPGSAFASYDLFQAISAVGMQYGEMKIFHYVTTTSSGKYSLFSLASATEPGYFDMDNMGDFSCAGLTLFMNARGVADPSAAFEIMYKTAEQLADDLGGELRAGQRQSWNEEMLSQYRNRVRHYAEPVV